MKIGIDVSQIVYETGVSWYTQKLVENLLNIDKENKYVLFGGSLRRIKDLRLKTKNLSAVKKFYPIPPTFADFIWNKLHILNIELFTGKLGVFHSSDWAQPPSNAFKVTTIHDFSPLKFENVTNPKIVASHKRRLKWVKEEVNRIIVPSKATLNDAIEFGFKKELLRVIPEASTFEKPSTRNEIVSLRRKYNIKRPFLLVVGVNERKNTYRIIQAYQKERLFKNYDLVLVGEAKIEIKKFQGLKIVGHITQEALRTFYSSAQVLVFSSLYEGFGLPILDAFECKCPVVASNISSMPEVAGNAAILVDPYDIDSIGSGIQDAIQNRNFLIQKGLARVKLFSWQKTTQETLEVYNESK